MFKKVFLYPFLFIFYVILIPLSLNLDQVDPALAVRPLVLILAFAVLALLILNFIFKDWHYAAYLVFLLLAFVFVFGHVWRLLNEYVPNPSVTALILLAGWAFVLVLFGLRKVWLRLGAGNRITPLLNLLFIAALLSQLGFTLLGTLRDRPRWVSASASEPIAGFDQNIHLDCSRQPDIYYIVLDAYSRSDVLMELYEVDNRAFLESLEEKGFYVADQTHTNYTQTIFSVASSLNLNYIGPNPPMVNGREYFSELISENQLAKLLNACGYQTIAFESGFFFTDHPAVDLYLSQGIWMNEFESLLFMDTPVYMLVNLLNLEKRGLGYKAHRERVLYAFEELGELASQPGPKFVFAHILSPHPPFVFDPQGLPIEPPRSYSIGDGDDFRGSLEEYRRGYAGQVQFVNRQLEQTVDRILAEAEAPPIIILQGDHGPGAGLNWSSPSKTCLAERTSILNAYYLPDGSSPLYPEITPVNSFRLILNEYFGTDLELLPDRTNFTSHRLERQVIDITGQRDSMDNCTWPGDSGPG